MELPVSVTRKVGRTLLKLEKHSPRLFFVGGVAGTIGATVLACRATLKLNKQLDDIQIKIEKINDRHEERMSVISHHGAAAKIEDIDWLHRRELTRTYIVGAGSIIKLYGPAVLLGVGAIAALTTSHVTLSNRNKALTAAYSAVAASFEAYRERVKAELGAEKELDIFHGARTEVREIEGKKTEIKVVDPNGYSMYSKIFDESNPHWVKNAEYNRMFVQCQQNYLQHILQARGHVFLNEAYDMLGFPHTEAGSVVGWLIGNGDSFIDFGIFEATSSDFVAGYERSIILDFNVDGIIFDKIG